MDSGELLEKPGKKVFGLKTTNPGLALQTCDQAFFSPNKNAWSQDLAVQNIAAVIFYVCAIYRF